MEIKHWCSVTIDDAHCPHVTCTCGWHAQHDSLTEALWAGEDHERFASMFHRGAW